MAFPEVRPAIVLVDDDAHCARLLTRLLEAHGSPAVTHLPDPEQALATLDGLEPQPMAIVDIKSSSTATADFIARLKQRLPQLLVVAMASTLDRDVRERLHDAGAAAVFERHADIALYRREVANMVSFWVRNQRLDAVGA